MRKWWAAGAAVGLVASACAKSKVVRDEPIDDFVTRVRLADRFEPLDEEPADPEETDLFDEANEQGSDEAAPVADLRTFTGKVRGLEGTTLILEDDAGSRREMLLTARTRIGDQALKAIARRAKRLFQSGARIKAAYAIEGFDLVAKELQVLEAPEPEFEDEFEEEVVDDEELEELDAP